MTVTANIAPYEIQRFFDAAGVPLDGGKLFTYAAGTTTKQTTYKDSTGGTPNTNPIILDSAGYCNLWLDATLAYKFTLSPATDTDPPTNPIWTVDQLNTSASPVLTAIAASSGSSLVGFLQAGAGAVAQTSQAVGREWITPQNFGAVADGVTDDSAAVLRANTAAAGMPILFEGTFHIPTSTTITSPIVDTLEQIFSATSNVTIANGQLVRPEWWGAYSDGSNAAKTTAAFALAISSGKSGVQMIGGTYLCDTVDLTNPSGTINNGKRLEGVSRKDTVIKGTASTVNLLKMGTTTASYLIGMQASNFTLDITDVPDLAANSAWYMAQTYDNTFHDILVTGVGTNKLSLAAGEGSYTSVFTSVSFDPTHGKLSLVGTAANNVTTFTFIGCSFAQVTENYVLSITFTQPIAQGDFDKFVLSNTYNHTVMGGDFEATTPSTYYMYNFGSGCQHIVSIGNEVGTNLYYTGNYGDSSYFMDHVGTGPLFWMVKTFSGTTASLATNAVATMFTASTGSTYIVSVASNSTGNGGWRGTFIVHYTTAGGAYITTLDSAAIACTASGANIQIQNTSASSALIVWSALRLG